MHVHYSDTFCDWIDANPFGAILYGQLAVAAAVRHGRLTYERDYDEDGGMFLLHVELLATDTTNNPCIVSTDCPTVDQLEIETGVLCLLIGTAKSSLYVREHMLLLQPLSGSANYKRVGISQNLLEGGSLFHDAEIRSVTIH